MGEETVSEDSIWVYIWIWVYFIPYYTYFGYEHFVWGGCYSSLDDSAFDLRYS